MPIIGIVASAISGRVSSSFMTVLNDASTLTGLDVIKDANGIYLAFNNATSSHIGGMRLDSTGTTMSWGVTENLGQYSGYNGISFASDGNLIFQGYNNQSGRQAGIAKLNISTGAQIWSYYYGVTGYGNKGSINGQDGNIYTSQQGFGGAGVLYTNSDGGSPVFVYLSGATYCTAATWSSASYNVYALVTGPAGNYHLTVWSLATPLLSQDWQREYNTNYSTGGNAVQDGSGTVYVATYGADSGTSGDRAILLKLNYSDGTILAQKTLDQGTGTFDGFEDCILDTTTSMLYAVGIGNNIGLIAKYDTSLNLQWQRTLSNTSNLSAITDFDADHILVTGKHSAGGIFVAKLKKDGSGTGTYTFSGGNVTYAASSLTSATSSFTSSLPGRSRSTTSLSRSNTTTINDAVTPTIQRQAV
jgi:hypothetical protein